MDGCVVTPAVTPGADLGVLFLTNEGYSTLCGHGIIALVTALFETGAMPAKGKGTSVNLDTPAGLVNLRVTPENTEQLVAAGEAIKQAVNGTLSIKHPIEADLSFLYGTILTGPPENPAHHSRNICVFANAEVDRSPMGTGVSARLALLHTKGEIVDGQQIFIESILGAASTFGGRIVGRAKVGLYEAIVPEVSGTAFITGRHEFIIDPRDELGRGFLLV
jgi:proline racemase